MQHFKTLCLTFPLMVICSSKAWADLSIPMVSGDNGLITDSQVFLLTGDSILLIGFLFWIAYIVFCPPKHTLKKS